MSGAVPKLLVRGLSPLLGESLADRVVAYVYAVGYLVYYYLSAQYARALLGIVWVVLTPLIFLAVYLPVLTKVFHGRLPGETGPYDYALFMLAGFLPWGAFSEGFGQGAGSVVNSPSVVRHAPMPPIVIPTIRVSSAFTALGLGLVIFVGVLAALGRFPGGRLVLLAPTLVVFYVFTLGLTWLASSITVYVRDLQQLIPTLLMVEFFACPVVYHPHDAPGALSTLVRWNPLTPFLALFRASLAPAAEFAWLDLAIAGAWAGGAIVVGAITFRSVEGGFGDAL